MYFLFYFGANLDWREMGKREYAQRTAARSIRETLMLGLLQHMCMNYCLGTQRSAQTLGFRQWNLARDPPAVLSCSPSCSLRLRGGAMAAKSKIAGGDDQVSASPEAGSRGAKEKAGRVRAKAKGRGKERDVRKHQKGAAPEAEAGAHVACSADGSNTGDMMVGEKPDTKSLTQSAAEQKTASKEDKDRRKEKRKRDKLKKRERDKTERQKKVPFRPWIDKAAPGETLMPDLSVYDCWFPLKVDEQSIFSKQGSARTHLHARVQTLKHHQRRSSVTCCAVELVCWYAVPAYPPVHDSNKSLRCTSYRDRQTGRQADRQTD